MDFDNVFQPNPAPALEIARREDGQIDQAAIDAVNEELNIFQVCKYSEEFLINEGFHITSKV